MAQIFLCHASEDKAQVRKVYQCLKRIDGFEPWLDEEDLLPGQDWGLVIPRRKWGQRGNGVRVEWKGQKRRKWGQSRMALS